ncbi:poly-gamma-glutamate hydrolase family protein [Haloarcula sediminis]|uniref:poly-gamma-glutamate hydrolase family protein n=1 Tax=Haloarcula sediminis TaxID=3111777 RepID=UPI002D7A24F4|nr:poly-gamma-glutamate hydrolase family protein [Haloarcula sp. CK38]
MQHRTYVVDGRDATDDDTIDEANRIAISAKVAAELKLVTGQQVTVTNQAPTPRRRADGPYLGAFRVAEITDAHENTVVLETEGRKLLSDETTFPATVRNQVPDNTLSVSEARRLNEFTETLQIAGYDSEVLVIAVHGGDVEANTDESASWFHKECLAHGVAADVYTARGFGKRNFQRWHVGSSSLHLRSFPKLREVAGRQYELVIAFHLHDVRGDGSPKILVGGRTDATLREQTAARLDDALPNKYAYITDRSQHSMMGGSHTNVVNWLSRDGESGLQIEVTPRVSQIRRKTVGREVARSVVEHLEGER